MKLRSVGLVIEPFDGGKSRFVSVFITDDCRLMAEGNEGGFEYAVGCFHGAKLRSIRVVRNNYFAFFLRTCWSGLDAWYLRIEDFWCEIPRLGSK